MRVVAIAVLFGVVLIAGGCTKAKPSPTPPPPGKSGVTMKISSAKAEYARGEPIVLTIELANAEASTCRVSRIPDGSLAFVSLTHDDNAVVPGDSVGSYIDGMAAHLRKHLVPMAPGASLSFELKSDRDTAMDKQHVLQTSTLDTLDQAALTYWPVDAPGKYALSARYVPPPVPGGPADVCRASGDPAQVTFTVLGG